MTQSALDRIIGAEKLISVFGCWPSFHDAEVIRMKLDRRSHGDRLGPSLETQVHTFEMTKDVDESGHYVLRDHILVHLRFQDVLDMYLEGFNHQNVLFGLEISDLREGEPEQILIKVRFDSSYGMRASFLCHAIEVLEVTPCNEDGICMRAGQ
jgi:hypothetical protein